MQFRFRIENLRKRDQTAGMFLIRLNEFGNRMFRALKFSCSLFSQCTPCLSLFQWRNHNLLPF